MIMTFAVNYQTSLRWTIEMFDIARKNYGNDAVIHLYIQPMQ